jgi:hypothetical protein
MLTTHSNVHGPQGGAAAPLPTGIPTSGVPARATVTLLFAQWRHFGDAQERW